MSARLSDMRHALSSDALSTKLTSMHAVKCPLLTASCDHGAPSQHLPDTGRVYMLSSKRVHPYKVHATCARLMQSHTVHVIDVEMGTTITKLSQVFCCTMLSIMPGVQRASTVQTSHRNLVPISSVQQRKLELGSAAAGAISGARAASHLCTSKLDLTADSLLSSQGPA